MALLNVMAPTVFPPSRVTVDGPVIAVRKLAVAPLPLGGVELVQLPAVAHDPPPVLPHSLTTPVVAMVSGTNPPEVPKV